MGLGAALQLGAGGDGRRYPHEGERKLRRFGSVSINLTKAGRTIHRNHPCGGCRAVIFAPLMNRELPPG